MAGRAAGAAGKDLLKYVQKFQNTKGAGGVGGAGKGLGGFGWLVGLVGGVVLLGWAATNSFFNGISFV